jgi:hypothetical protein
MPRMPSRVFAAILSADDGRGGIAVGVGDAPGAGVPGGDGVVLVEAPEVAGVLGADRLQPQAVGAPDAGDGGHQRGVWLGSAAAGAGGPGAGGGGRSRPRRPAPRTRKAPP